MIWVEEAVVLALHDEQIAEHGGPARIRDRGLLESALARPQNLAAYGDPDIADLAAAYAVGIARSRPFFDGNKRTSLVVAETFLLLNGRTLTADDASCLSTWLAIADGTLGEPEFAGWLRANIT